MIISKITINELKEVDLINLTINDNLLDYINKEGVFTNSTPSSFIIINVGINILNLDIVM